MTDYWCYVIGLVIGGTAGCIVAMVVNAHWARYCKREIEWWSNRCNKLVDKIEKYKQALAEEVTKR